MGAISGRPTARAWSAFTTRSTYSKQPEIDVEEFTRYGELFHVPLLFGVGMLLLEAGLRRTVLRSLP